MCDLAVWRIHLATQIMHLSRTFLIWFLIVAGILAMNVDCLDGAFLRGDSGTPSLFVQAANPWYNHSSASIDRFVRGGSRQFFPIAAQQCDRPKSHFSRS